MRFELGNRNIEIDPDARPSSRSPGLHRLAHAPAVQRGFPAARPAAGRRHRCLPRERAARCIEAVNAQGAQFALGASHRDGCERRAVLRAAPRFHPDERALAVAVRRQRRPWRCARPCRTSTASTHGMPDYVIVNPIHNLDRARRAAVIVALGAVWRGDRAAAGGNAAAPRGLLVRASWRGAAGAGAVAAVAALSLATRKFTSVDHVRRCVQVVVVDAVLAVHHQRRRAGDLHGR